MFSVVLFCSIGQEGRGVGTHLSGWLGGNYRDDFLNVKVNANQYQLD